MSPILPTFPTAQATGALVCLLLAVIAFLIRIGMERRHEARLGQIARSAQLLAIYAHHLDAFLSAPGAPASLKRIAVSFSAFIEDREAVEDFASWASVQPLGSPVTSEATLEVLRTMDQLTLDAPALASSFSSILVNGALGALLRWPGSAKLFALSSPAVVSDWTTEVAAVVHAVTMGRDARVFGSAGQAGLALAN